MNKCLRKFYDCNETTGLFSAIMLTSNRAAIERTHVRDEQNNRPFSIIVDSEFTKTNKAFNLLLEALIRSGKKFHGQSFARKRPLFVEHMV